jgi:Mrp family chromosome partitioning ATPase
MCGLALGIAAAWLWDRVSDRVRSPAELARTGWPVLASDLDVPVDAWSPVTVRSSDDFALVAARLSTMTQGRREGVRVLVASPVRRSGSSSVAANTASALLAMGRHVVLIDADVSSPGVSTLVPGGTRPGFLEVLDGTCSPESGLQTVGTEGLRVLPAPAGVQLPGIDTDILSLMLGQLASRNIVVIDGPPLLESSAGVVLANHVDVVLLVADLRQLRRREVAETARLLEGIGDVSVCWVSHHWRPRYESPDRRSRPAHQRQPVDQAVGSAGGS